jgi:hypothetical protein
MVKHYRLADSPLLVGPADSSLLVGPADGPLLVGPADDLLLVGPADSPLLEGLDYCLLKVVLADGALLVRPSDGPSTGVISHYINMTVICAQAYLYFTKHHCIIFSQRNFS